MMKGRGERWDRISALPEDIIGKILSHVRMRDAIRTSILSKKWRYCWTRMPKLVIDKNLVKISSGNEDIKRCKLLRAIFHVLLLHRGNSISELYICTEDREIVYGIEPIIHHLSWSKSIKKFFFIFFTLSRHYKLPCSFFSLQGLEHLTLNCCEVEIPLMFNGFSMLKSLVFYQVKITANMLQRFLISCPLLEEFVLRYDVGEPEFTVGSKCTFVELFKCLPSIQAVNISWTYVKQLATGGMSQKLPTSLVYLRILVLDVCFQKLDELSSTLFVISSSPNLENIKLKCVGYMGQTYSNLLDYQEYYTSINLDHLKEMQITCFGYHPTEMEFVKLIMAKSPMLKKAQIELNSHVSVDKEVKMLRDLLLLPFPRASPAAKFIITPSKFTITPPI